MALNPAGGDTAPLSSGGKPYQPMPGSPKDIARTMQIFSIVGISLVVLVSVFFDCLMR